MTDKRHLTWLEVQTAVDDLSSSLRLHFGDEAHVRREARIYGVPRGGRYIAAMLSGMGFTIVDDPCEANAIVDDVIDSGKTRDAHAKFNVPFFAAFESYKPREDGERWGWLVFPWETVEEPEGGERNVERLLQLLGEDPKRDGLLATPGRYVRALRDLTRGYSEEPKTILSTSFAEHHDEMIVLRDIEFWSLCEHHLLPFHGKAHVGYIPKEKGRIVGLSKLARLVECFARRLQVQERMTDQIALALVEHLDARGAACVVEGAHLCMAMRGVQKQGVMVTSSLHGAMREPAVRAEFLRLVGK